MINDIRFFAAIPFILAASILLAIAKAICPNGREGWVTWDLITGRWIRSGGEDVEP